MNNLAELAVREIEKHIKLPERLKAAGASTANSCINNLPGVAVARDVSGALNSEAFLSGVNSNGVTSPTTPPVVDGEWAVSTRKNQTAKLVEDDVDPIVSAYSNVTSVRNIDEALGACILIVDTAEDGWRIMFVSNTWSAWTGGCDRGVAMGSKLDELLQHCHGDSHVVWPGVQREAMEGRAFVTPKVRGRSQHAMFCMHSSSTQEDGAQHEMNSCCLGSFAYMLARPGC